MVEEPQNRAMRLMLNGLVSEMKDDEQFEIGLAKKSIVDALCHYDPAIAAMALALVSVNAAAGEITIGAIDEQDKTN